MTTIYVCNGWIGADRNHAAYLNKPRYFAKKLATSRSNTVVVAVGGFSQSADVLQELANLLEISFYCFSKEDTDFHVEGRRLRKKAIEIVGVNTALGMVRYEDGKITPFLIDEDGLDFPFREDGIVYGTGDMIAKAEYHRQQIRGEFCMQTIMEKATRIDTQSEGIDVFCGEHLTPLSSIDNETIAEAIKELNK